MSFRKRCSKHGHVWVARPNATELLWVHCSRIGCTAVQVASWVPSYMVQQVYDKLAAKDRCRDDDTEG